MDDMMLIVDDVEINREILKVLFNEKYEIIEAETGEEAMAMLEGFQGSIDIVLLDLMLPGISGFDILEKKRECDFLKNEPIVVITGSGNQKDQIKAFDLGANDYISKPFVPEIVVSRINNVMASNRRMLSVELEAQKMRIKSELDEMTGLYNKTTTENLIDGVLKVSDSRRQVMMVIDIDNFKAVNDTSGHQSGDHVIKIVANLISGLFRKTDIVGRIGGDEFCVLMVDVPNMSIVYDKVNELIQVMRYKPNLTIPEYVTLSIGVATNDRKNTTYPYLFKMADDALYQAKQGGKAQYREYGVEPVRIENDTRSVAILLSNNRSVCSVIHALIPSYVRIVEVLHEEDLLKLDQRTIDRFSLIYVDVSDRDGDVTDYLQQVKKIEWISEDNIIVICEEGNVKQYLASLNCDIADMLSTPIPHDAFKRCTIRNLERLGIVEQV